MYFGNFGAAAGGAVEGMQVAQQRQEAQQRAEIQQFNLQRARDQAAQQQATMNAQRAAQEAYRKTLQDVYGGPMTPAGPSQVTPLPGQASVPMSQPGSAPQPLPPYRAMPSAGQPPTAQDSQPFAIPARPQVSPPAAAATPAQGVQQAPAPAQQEQVKLTMQAIVANAPNQPQAFDEYMSRMLPMLSAQDKSELYMAKQQIAAQKELIDEQNIKSQIGARDKGDWGEPYQGTGGALLQKNNKTNEIRQITKPSAAGGGTGSGNLGHLNTFLARETKDLAPITDAQKKSSVVLALLDSGNAVSTAQVQQALSDMYTHLRATNHIYADNKNFGNVYQRMTNALNRFASGKYSSDDTKMIKDMITQMNDKVFAPARGNVIKNYKKQAKTFGYDPAVADQQDAYGGAPDASPAIPAAAGAGSGIPSGWSVKEH